MNAEQMKRVEDWLKWTDMHSNVKTEGAIAAYIRELRAENERLREALKQTGIGPVSDVLVMNSLQMVRR